MSEYYRFNTAFDTWRYVDGKRDKTFMGQEWVSAAIRRGKWERDLVEQEITIKVPHDMPPIQQFIATNPAGILWVRVFDSGGVQRIVGRCGPVTFKKEDLTAEINVIATQRPLTGGIPTDLLGIACNNDLFDGRCGLSKDQVDGTGTFKWKRQFPLAEATLGAGNLSIIHPKIAEKSNGFFSFGFARCGSEDCFILKHEGDTVELLNPFVRLPNVTLEVYAGCSKTLPICKSKFGNNLNFVGLPFRPTANPTTQGF